MQIKAPKKEYRPFTKQAAHQIAKEFGIPENEETLFDLITGTTTSYERYRQDPNYRQKKNALDKLSKGLRELEIISGEKEQALKDPLFDTLMRLVGEFLDYGALEKLLGVYIGRPPTIPQSRMQHRDADERRALDRAVVASQAGPKLLVALFREMHSAVEVSLARIPPHKGGRPIKHGFRQALIARLAWEYDRFFDERPKTTLEGPFYKFSYAILEQMDCDVVGLDKAITTVFKKMGLLPLR